MDLKEEHILKDQINSHWYYQSKAAVIQREISKMPCQKIADIGAGSGFFSRLILENTPVNSAVCIDTAYEDEEKSDTCSGKTIDFLRSPPKKIESDVTLMIDVLEHIDDDHTFLKDYSKRLKKGSYVVMSVPAFNFMWSSHDVFLEHKRRYTLKNLEHLAESSGLKIERSFYYFAGVFPLAFLSRIPSFFEKRAQHAQSQLQRHSFFVNILLRTICRIESFIYSHNRLFGLSAFCIARRCDT